jgi:hypothetical protein
MMFLWTSWSDDQNVSGREIALQIPGDGIPGHVAGWSYVAYDFTWRSRLDEK